MKTKKTSLRIAVLFGGTSAERAVSIATGLQVYLALRSRGHAVLAVDTERGILTGAHLAAFLRYRLPTKPPPSATRRRSRLLETVGELRAARIDAVFVALHGGAGENGTVQALLATAGLRFTGSDHRACAVATDKGLAKQLFRTAGVPTPDWVVVGDAWDRAALKALGRPVIIKPRSEGSTVGLSLVRRAGDLGPAIAKARGSSASVLAERYVAGRELTVGILEGEALSVGEIMLGGAPVFDYGRKYAAGRVREVFPARLTARQTKTVQRLAVAATAALGLAPYARADFRMDTKGGFWCLEVNALPGLSAASLFPQSAAAVGMPFEDLCERLVRLALGTDGPT